VAGDLLNEIRGENLKIYHTSSQRLREDVGQEDEIARDYRGRLVYELIQNADDAMDPGRPASLLIELHADGLWFANSGRELVEGDVRGICGISASTKRVEGEKKRASIGHKGMGFKSVLEISRAPEVYSTSYSFRFDEPQSLTLLRDAGFRTKHAPLMRLPWPIESQRANWRRLRDEGMVTAFFLPFVDETRQTTFEAVAKALRTLPETTFLFLKRLEAVEIVVHDETPRRWTLTREYKTNGDWSRVASMGKPGLYRIRLDAGQDAPAEFRVAHDGDIEIGDHRGGLAGVAWEDVDVTEVSVAVRVDGGVPAPASDPLVHVFLPTGERMPYPFLINGAFASGLSRQSIRVEEDPRNYNGFLIQQAARLLSDTLFPALAAVDRRETILLLKRDQSIQSPLSAAVYQAVRNRIADQRLVPAEDGTLLAPGEVLLPPLLKGVGEDFRAVLATSVTSDHGQLPAGPWCAHDVAVVLSDHGATAVEPGEAAELLSAAPRGRSLAEDDMERAVVVDPVLRILQKMWEGYDETDRLQLVKAVRSLPLMPVDLTDGRTWRREAVGGLSSFYPPQFLRSEVPLPGLCFLSQSICWGALNRQERQETLKSDMVAWQGLFGLQEFKFPEVMRASVLPFMTFERVRDRALFHDISKLAAICQLSGKTSQRGHLPTERLGSQRALFNLARLEVPCRGPEGGVRWVSAYRAYFGKDWIGTDSVECLLEACQQAGHDDLPDVPFVLGPESFVGHLKKYESLTDGTELDDGSDGDEVGLDEDEDAALPTEEFGRWREFLSWLGVNEHLRAVHFHDVEDRDSRWLNTEGLQKPRGWIFETIPEELWKAWSELFSAKLAEREPRRAKERRLWFYDVHHLEHLDALLIAAAADKSGAVGQALYRHLQGHWPKLRRVESAVAALTEGNPRRRREPKKAYDGELIPCCENFWLWRLRQVAFCPTAHGPRLPSQAWLAGRELERRFQRTGPLLPVLEVEEPGSLASRLGVRSELTPSAFTLDDAEVWLERLELVTTDAPDGRRSRLAISVACRHLMELLAGSQPSETRPQLRLPANHGGELVWLPAKQVFFAERRRADGEVAVPTFVLEGEPRARAPLQVCFGVRLLEESLNHKPSPGDAALTGADLDLFRKSLWIRGPALLARIGAERQEERQAASDARRMRELLQGVLPVTTLSVATTLDGQAINGEGGKTVGSYVDRTNPSCAFVRWGEDPWPPTDDEAERLSEALCEFFGPNWYESFLAIIKARDEAARLRILRRAGAPLDLEEYARRLAGEFDPSARPTGQLPNPRTPGQAPMAPLEPTGRPDEADTGEDTPVHPLWPVDSLLVLGSPVRVETEEPDNDDGASNVRERGPGSRSSRGRPGIRTDLTALDRLGMQIAITFEAGRLARHGGGRVFDVSHPDLIRAAWSDLREVFERDLLPHGIGHEWPGFDLLSLTAAGTLDRMIELKSSGVAARTQECTWNEWKSAGRDSLRERYYLYLVGNLRADLQGQLPFVRTVQDPFGQLRAEVRVQTKVERKVQLAVSRFRQAEEEVLQILTPCEGSGR